MLDIIVEAPIEERLREQWLERLWTAVEEDGVDLLWEVTERWGELCGTRERASRAADDLLSVLRLSWSEEHGGYFRGTPPADGWHGGTTTKSPPTTSGRHWAMR